MQVYAQIDMHPVRQFEDLKLSMKSLVRIFKLWPQWPFMLGGAGACITNTLGCIKVSSVDAGRCTEASIQTLTATRTVTATAPLHALH